MIYHRSRIYNKLLTFYHISIDLKVARSATEIVVVEIVRGSNFVLNSFITKDVKDCICSCYVKCVTKLIMTSDDKHQNLFFKIQIVFQTLTQI